MPGERPEQQYHTLDAIRPPDLGVLRRAASARSPRHVQPEHGRDHRPHPPVPAEERGVVKSAAMLRDPRRLLTVILALCGALTSASAQVPVYVSQWGSLGAGVGQFDYATGIATDASGNVYVADNGNYRIQKFNSAGGFLTTWGHFWFPGLGGSGDGLFGYPSAVAVGPDGNVYVVDQDNARVQVFSADGAFLHKWGSKGSGIGQFYLPMGVAIDAAGDVFIVEWGNNRVQKFTSAGTYLLQWGAFGSGPGQFWNASGIAVSSTGDVYVSDRDNGRIQKFTSDGVVVTEWGVKGSGNGQLLTPEGVKVDAGGLVYVADSANDRVQVFGPDGAYLTQWGSNGSGNGQFLYPEDVAFGPGGAIYVVDRGNNRIQAFGHPPTAAHRSSWGRVKALYR
jgi:tripartite motif-containing protein 71